MTENRSQVLVLELHRYSLTIARSLDIMGFDTILGVTESSAYRHFAKSRFVRDIWIHPPFHKISDFTQALQKFVRERPGIVAIFPAGEHALSSLWGRKDYNIQPALVMCSEGVARHCLDKWTSIEIARIAGLPVLESKRVWNVNELRDAIHTIGLPVAIKPSCSGWTIDGKKCIFINSKQKISSFQWPSFDDGIGLIVQPMFKGFRHNCMFLAKEGVVLRYFESRVIRTNADNGTGYSIESVSVEPSNTRRMYVESLARHLNYTSLGCMQFLVCPETKDMVFLELNPRIDATCALPVTLGLNFPAWSVQQALNIPQYCRWPEKYQTGIKHTWTFGALEAWRDSFNDSSIINILARLGSIVLLSLTSKAHATFEWRDPLPTLSIYRERSSLALASFIKYLIRRIQYEEKI